MVIVEGPDGAGKSTLVQHLGEKFGLEIGKRGVANRDKLYEVTRKDTYRALSLAVLNQDPPQIWDRLFISEFVYHNIAPGRPCEFGPEESVYIREVLDAIGCPVIVCLPPFDVIEANALADHQMDGVNENITTIYRHYAHGDLPWPSNTLWYDYTGDTEDWSSLADVEEEVEGYLESRKTRSSAWA